MLAMLKNSRKKGSCKHNTAAPHFTGHEHMKSYQCPLCKFVCTTCYVRLVATRKQSILTIIQTCTVIHDALYVGQINKEWKRSVPFSNKNVFILHLTGFSHKFWCLTSQHVLSSDFFACSIYVASSPGHSQFFQRWELTSYHKQQAWVLECCWIFLVWT